MTMNRIWRSARDLALFGAEPLFTVPKSTSNLVQPDFSRFLVYSREAYATPASETGSVTRRLEERLAQFHSTAHCVSFCSGFWALATTMVALARPGAREVVMPSLTYRRMADVVAWTGLVPRFCEVDPDSLSISAATAREHIGENTALLLGVHPIVNTCDVSGLVELAGEHGVPLMFDSVESVYEYSAAGRVGGHGRAECFSLHASKLLNGFEGGYVTTSDPELATTLAALRDGDTMQPGSIDARLADVHAAMALANLDGLDAQVEMNKARYLHYKALLPRLPGIRLLEFDTGYRTSFKNIVVELTDDWPLSRALTIRLLNAERILSRAYYSPPLHAKPMAYPHVPAHLPSTDRLAERFVLMPCGDFVSIEDIEVVVDLLSCVHAHADEINACADTREATPC